MDYSPPGSSVHGILQTGLLEWVAFPSPGNLTNQWVETASPALWCFGFQFRSVAQLCPTFCNPMNHRTLGLPVHHQFLEFTQTHVNWVGDAIENLTLCWSLLLLPSIFPSIRVFSSESALHIRWPKYWSFSFNISSSINTKDSFPLGGTGWISLQSKGFSRVFANSTVQKHQFFGAQLSLVQISHPYITPGKTIALTRWTFVGKVMSLLFNVWSRLVITFLPRSKHLLILLLQRPSAVVLEPKNKVWHCFHCFPIYLPWSDGTRCHDLSFLNVEL